MESKSSYLEMIFEIERLHRLFLENIKAELESRGIYNINNIQAMILYNIGEGQISVGELTNRGYYLGSNVSYNLHKMVDNGFIIQQVSTHDKRSTIVKLSEEGLKLRAIIDEIMAKHIDALDKQKFSIETVKDISNKLKDLENIWFRGSLIFR